MQLKSLGKTNIRVPEIGLGTHRYTAGVVPLKTGIELGASFVDTAESYGTENVVGKAVRDIRDRVTIATKVSPSNLRYPDIMDAADRSLEKLQIEYIDLYQIHHFNPDVPLAETLGAMEDLVHLGKVRFIGVCNFSIKQLKLCHAALNNFPIVTNQIDFSLITRHVEKGLFQYCEESGITIIAHSPLGRGMLNMEYRDRNNALSNIATMKGKSKSQVALNWCISHENVIAIPKSNSINRIEDNCNASNWRLSVEHVKLLEGSIKPIRRRGATEIALRRAARRGLIGMRLRP